PATFFAPTDQAFASLSQSDIDKLMNDPAKTKALLSRLLVPQELTTQDLLIVNGTPLATADQSATVTGKMAAKTQGDLDGGAVLFRQRQITQDVTVDDPGILTTTGYVIPLAGLPEFVKA